MAELAYRSLVWHRLVTQIDAHEAAHHRRVVQRLFHPRGRQVEPLLQKVNAQHPLHTQSKAWRKSPPTAMRAVRRAASKKATKPSWSLGTVRSFRSRIRTKLSTMPAKRSPWLARSTPTISRSAK